VQCGAAFPIVPSATQVAGQHHLHSAGRRPSIRELSSQGLLFMQLEFCAAGDLWLCALNHFQVSFFYLMLC
jgi:hypothetical protein